jgi:hypothetical protein
MIEAVARIKAAASSDEQRVIAASWWSEYAPTLFEPHDPREGSLRVSDAGQCVRALWNEIHAAPKVFSPDVQLFNLDEGHLTGLWHACLLAASLGEDGYDIELESEVVHDGTPGHFDLYYELGTLDSMRGIIEFKKTMWPRALTPAADRAPYQVLQLMKYCAALGVEQGAIVTVGPASPDKMREDWYSLSDWTEAVIEEYDRLSAALGDVEPVEDAKEKWRCKDCPVLACQRNPQYSLEDALERSLA